MHTNDQREIAGKLQALKEKSLIGFFGVAVMSAALWLQLRPSAWFCIFTALAGLACAGTWAATANGRTQLSMWIVGGMLLLLFTGLSAEIHRPLSELLPLGLAFLSIGFFGCFALLRLLFKDASGS